MSSLLKDLEQRAVDAGPRWKYQRRDDWFDYGRTETAALEQAFLSSNGEPGQAVDLMVGGEVYHVDLHRMKQRNVKSGKERAIRRINMSPEEWENPLNAEQMVSVLKERSHKASEDYPSSVCAQLNNIEVVSIEAVKN